MGARGFLRPKFRFLCSGPEFHVNSLDFPCCLFTEFGSLTN
jgi:hypothetical protein